MPLIKALHFINPNNVQFICEIDVYTTIILLREKS